jgi:hypothetical protein
MKKNPRSPHPKLLLSVASQTPVNCTLLRVVSPSPLSRSSSRRASFPLFCPRPLVTAWGRFVRRRPFAFRPRPPVCPVETARGMQRTCSLSLCLPHGCAFVCVPFPPTPSSSVLPFPSCAASRPSHPPRDAVEWSREQAQGAREQGTTGGREGEEEKEQCDGCTPWCPRGSRRGLSSLTRARIGFFFCPALLAAHRCGTSFCLLQAVPLRSIGPFVPVLHC